MDENTRKYLSSIGKRGGQKSKRQLTSDQAKEMVRIREARKYFREFYAQCFWSLRPDLQITIDRIPMVIEKLRSFGGPAGWKAAEKLCR